MAGTIFQVVFYALCAGFALAAARALLPLLRRRLLRERLRRSGVRGVGRIVEVSVLEEGTDGGEYRLFGVLPVVTARDRNGVPLRPTLPTYRILVRHTPPGGAELVADAEHELSVPELDHLVPDRSVDIRYDPARPDSVILDRDSLHRAVAAGPR